MLDTKACKPKKGARTSFTKSQGNASDSYKAIIRLLRQRIARLIPHCDTCGICIGPDYIEHNTTKVGKRELCGNCLHYLGKYGFLQLDYRHRLLPNGGIIDRAKW